MTIQVGFISVWDEDILHVFYFLEISKVFWKRSEDLLWSRNVQLLILFLELVGGTLNSLDRKEPTDYMAERTQRFKLPLRCKGSPFWFNTSSEWVSVVASVLYRVCSSSDFPHSRRIKEAERVRCLFLSKFHSQHYAFIRTCFPIFNLSSEDVPQKPTFLCRSWQCRKMPVAWMIFYFCGSKSTTKRSLGTS